MLVSAGGPVPSELCSRLLHLANVSLIVLLAGMFVMVVGCRLLLKVTGGHSLCSNAGVGSVRQGLRVVCVFQLTVVV